MKIQDTASSLRTVTAPLDRELPTPSKRAGLPEVSMDGDRADLASAQLARTVAADSSTDPALNGLSPDRVQSIRARISSNFYDRPASIDQTAEKIVGFYSRQ